MHDIRDAIFRDIMNTRFHAELIPEQDGCLSGVADAGRIASEIGIQLSLHLNEGGRVSAGTPIGEIIATPKKIAISEEKIIGSLAKLSGIATAAQRAVSLANGKTKIVAGSWKKMPPAVKECVRMAIVSGGASFRITNQPMVYLDKNYIAMLGSIKTALDAVKEYRDVIKVVQIKGKQIPIEEETIQALENGCGILMVDTGNINDLVRCSNTVNQRGKRRHVEIAFAGGVRLEQIPELTRFDIDIVCIGKEIVDAPLLDMRLDVLT